MFIIWIIFLLFLTWSTIQYDKAVLASFPFTLLFTTIPLFRFGGVEISLNMAIYLYLCILFIIKKPINNVRNPYYKPIVVISIGFVIVGLLGAYHSSLYIVFTNCFNYLILLIIWPFLRDKKDIDYIVKCLLIACFIITSYSIVEFLLQKNIWLDFIKDSWRTKADNAIYVDHLDDIRFGYGRCCSFFHFPIPFGDVCAIFFTFLLFWNTYSSRKLSKLVFISIMTLLFLGVLLSNSRAPMVMLMLGCLVMVDFKFIMKNKAMLILILFFLFFGVYNYFNEVIKSITDSSSENVSGSSLDMRLIQFAYCYQEFITNPWFGGGFNRMEELQNPENRELMGGESLLFVLMINQGLCGIITYVYACWHSIKAFPIKCRRFPLLLITCWVLGAVMSLTTGVYLTYPMLLLLITYRSYQLGLLKYN